MTFTKGFSKYVCEGDSIHCVVNGLDCKAVIYWDDINEAPDQRSDGFWPSKNKNDAGYVLPEHYEAEMAKATAIMDAWKRDEWRYCGVAVTVAKCGVTLTGKYDHALWGIEANYPGSDNAYLRDVANELLGEAISAAKGKLDELCDRIAAKGKLP
jgi:hypothetical protein